MESSESMGHPMGAPNPAQGPEDGPWPPPEEFNPVHPLDRPPSVTQLALWGSAPTLFTLFAYATSDEFIEFLFGPAIFGIAFTPAWIVMGIVLFVRAADREYEGGIRDGTFWVLTLGVLSLLAPLALLATLTWLTGPPSDRSLLADFEDHREDFRELGTRFSAACESGEQVVWEEAGCLADKLNARKLLYRLDTDPRFEAGPRGFTIAVHPTDPGFTHPTTGYAYILSLETVDPAHFHPSYVEEGRSFDSYGLRPLEGHWYLFGGAP